MNPLKWLAVLPVIAFFSGGWLSASAPAFVLGLPFLMVWNVAWLVLSSLIMWAIDRSAGDPDAGDIAPAGESR